MNKYTLAFLIFCIATYGYSQQGWQPGMLVNYSDQSYLNSKVPETFTGSQYLEDSFVKGTIHDDTGNSQNALLRYNALDDIVEIKVPDQPGIHVLPKVKNLSYSLNDYKYIFDSFTSSKGEMMAGFFIEYYNGESFGLYGDPVPKAHLKGKNAHLSVGVDYYVKKENGTLHSVKLNKKDFKNVLPVSKELDEYMAGNSLNTPQDFAAMLLWFENL